MSDKKSVLVVEDDEQLGNLFRDAISLAYNCELVRSLEEAKARIAVDPFFDCIVLDLMLPNGAGIDLVKDLDVRTPSCPIVIVSGYDVTKGAIMDAGAQVLLLKPVMPPQLLGGIAEAIGKWGDEAERRRRVDRCFDCLEKELGSALARARAKLIS